MDTTELLVERAKTHGDYALHADLTQNLKIALHSAPNWLTLNAMQREALEMIAHKIGRVLAGRSDFKDHWDDIAGYAKLVADRCPA